MEQKLKYGDVSIGFSALAKEDDTPRGDANLIIVGVLLHEMINLIAS